MRCLQRCKAKAMLHNGINLINGITVEVVRKRVRRINLRVSPGGAVCLSMPMRGATLSEVEKFLLSKMKWLTKTLREMEQRPALGRVPVTVEELARLNEVLTRLNERWMERLQESGVSWRVRQMKSLWGSCHIRKRQILYNAELARAPENLVEYVVVHELTHLCVANHGPRFQQLMSERLPGWEGLRRALNTGLWRGVSDLESGPNLPPAECTLAQCQIGVSPKPDGGGKGSTQIVEGPNMVKWVQQEFLIF